MSKKHDKDFLMSRKYATFVANEYAKKIEKAIEYIKRYESIRAYYEYQDGEYWEFNYDDDFQKDLLNILQGEDKDE